MDEGRNGPGRAGGARELEVTEGGARLDSWLTSATGIPRSEAQRLIAEGLVKVDGAGASKSTKLVVGQRVTVSPKSAPATAGGSRGYAVRYEDTDLAVIAKPAGVVVHPAPGTTSQTLVEALRERMPLAAAAGEGRPGIVHRLDKDTSGLLVVAKTDRAYRALAEGMQARQIERGYLTLVAGTFVMSTGRIEAPIGRSPKDRRRMGVAGEREAVTEFRVERSFGALVSLLAVKLLTGRTHQIRVHLSHFGHPVVGDPVYGKRTSEVARRIGLRRLFLHAAELRFVHPFSGAEIFLVEELPADLAEALERAERQLGG